MAEALVAGAIVSSVFNVLFERLASQQVVDFFKRNKLDKRLLDKLKTRMNTVDALLDDAEEKQITSPAVKKWLDDLKDASYQADDFLDEIAYKAHQQQQLDEAGPKTCLYLVRSFFSSLNLCKKGMSEMEPGLKEIYDRLEDLLQQTSTLGLVTQVGVRPPTSHGRVTTSLVDDSSVYGRDADKEAIVNVLLSDDATGKNLGVVPIVGMGGVGKTTLAQLVYNDSRVKQRFDKLRAWVCVSEEFDVPKLTTTIVKEIGLSVSDSTPLNQLQLKLEQELKGGRVLLVLDDVWNDTYADWELLLAPLTSVARGSKVLVTTRNESVASVMSTVQSHHLQALSEDDCWLLFSKLAFDGCSPDVYRDLEGIGRSIVRKCKGLPLAAKALGGLLRSKRDVKGWEMILKSNMWDLPSDNIIPALRLSYHYLPPHLKQCFAYCAIFPKDFRFSKKELALLWMAEGFIVQSYEIREMEEMGDEYFEELALRSFFQRYNEEDADRFVMHDLINDLAKSIAGEFCYTADDADSGKLSKRTRHLYCQAYGGGEDLKEGLIRAEFLRTFIASADSYEGRNLLSLLSGRLRVLALIGDGPHGNNEEADRLIRLLGSFKYLRFLRLQSMPMKELPENVSMLYYLQTLILDYCGGNSNGYRLPDSISSLTNLRYLSCEKVPLIALPDSIGDLKELRHLNLTRTKIELLPDSIGNLKNLKHLALKETPIKLLPDSIGNLKNLKYLNLWSTSITLLPDSIGNLKNLEHLNLRRLSMTLLPDSIGNLKNLKRLILRRTSITLLPDSIGNLKNLRSLDLWRTSIKVLPDSICNLKNLKVLNLWSTSIKLLPDSIGNLKDLWFLNLGLSSIERLPESMCVLYSLQHLSLDGCTEITELPAKITDLANLCHLGIRGTHLRSMPPHMGKLTNLQTLPFFRVGKDRETSIRELGELRHLRGCLSLEGLQNVADAEEGLEAKLKDKSGLEELIYSWAENGDADDCGSVHRSLLRNLQPHESIKRITVCGYRGRDFPGWVGDSSFINITVLHLEDCKYCTYLPPLGQLSSLETLILKGFDSIVSVGAEFYGDSNSVQPFRSLRKLKFINMPRWKEWSCHKNETTQDGFVVFPRLTDLNFIQCPELKDLGQEVFPFTLQSLGIMACPLLEQRFRREQGEDWPKIRHIPYVYSNSRRI